MKAVILESYVMEPGDLDWSGVKALVPDTVSYVRTAYEEIAPRIGDADLVLLNKCRIDENILAQCPNLKWVGIIATGTDNLDLEACRRRKPFGPGYRRKLNEVQLVPQPGGILLQKCFRALQLLHDAGVLPPGEELHALVLQPAAQRPVRAADRNVKDHGLVSFAG